MRGVRVGVALLAAAAALGAAAPQALGAGTLVVCQSSTNGMAERPFEFTLNGGAPLTVTGGRCSGPLALASGYVTVQQLQTDPATTVTEITAPVTRLDRSLSPNPDLAGRKATVAVVEGTTQYTGTRVTFTNDGAAWVPAPPPDDGGGGSGGAGASPPPAGTGALEICKFMAPGEPAFDGRAFGFRIDGTMRVTVRAGRCTLPIYLAPGDHVITELLDKQFELAGVETLPAGRLVSTDLGAATAVVHVPAGVENETVAIFRNRVARGQVKLCKAISPGSTDSLSGKTFTLSYSYGSPLTTVTVMLRPGECSLPSRPIPVIDAAGNPTMIAVDEVPGAGYTVSGVTLQGTAGPLVMTGCPTQTPFGCFALGRNTNVVTFTNRAVL